MGGNILQQNLYSRLSAQMKRFSLLDFMFPVNFVQVESATFIALETQSWLHRLFLFLTPPINKYVSFFFFSPYSSASSPTTMVFKFTLYAGKTCSYMTGRNTVSAQ